MREVSLAMWFHPTYSAQHTCAHVVVVVVVVVFVVVVVVVVPVPTGYSSNCTASRPGNWRNGARAHHEE